MLCLEVWRERRIQGSRGKESSGKLQTHLMSFNPITSTFTHTCEKRMCCLNQGLLNISYTKLSGRQLIVSKNPVGVDSCARVIDLFLHTKVNDVRMVGIHGLGGIGKTTIAKVVYNRIFEKFEESCFLKNVRENFGTNDGII